MPKFIKFERLERAVRELTMWRNTVNSQGAVHLWQFLALRHSGVATATWTRHEEAQDEAFWEGSMKVREGAEPYYDPLTNKFRIETHWHSNVATARKNTFKNRWHAAEVNPSDENEWRLADNYLDLLIDNAWTRGGTVTRAPVYSLCAWLYRLKEFPEDATLETVTNRFRTDFNLTAVEYSRLFQELTLEGAAEAATDFFTEDRPDGDRIRIALEVLADVPQRRSHSAAQGQTQNTPVSVDDGISPERIATLLAEGRGQVILYGPPGTGKTFVAKAAIANILNVPYAELDTRQIDPSALDTKAFEKFKKGGWTLIQFHPSYVYEDFIRGIVGRVDASGHPSFEVQDRTFAKLCQLASTAEGFIVLVIDEINRGDLAKVLGELIYALEYRDQPISLQYATKDGSLLTVPRRLLLVATMNTSDRSLAHLDYAIRRRFDFVHCGPNRKVVENFHEGSPIAEKALALFDATTSLVGPHRDYAIGHAFFLHGDSESLARAFTFQVLPLLAEYRVEGLIDVDSVVIQGWPAGPISLSQSIPFEFADALSLWLSGSSDV